MKFMLLIAGDEEKMNSVPTVGQTGMSEEFAAYSAALIKSGALVSGERLRPTNAATTVRVRDGKAVVLAGPYVEAQEQLGGYYILDLPTLDEAIEWARKCPSAKTGSIEVRPIWPTERN